MLFKEGGHPGRALPEAEEVRRPHPSRGVPEGKHLQSLVMAPSLRIRVTQTCLLSKSTSLLQVAYCKKIREHGGTLPAAILSTGVQWLSTSGGDACTSDSPPRLLLPEHHWTHLVPGTHVRVPLSENTVCRGRGGGRGSKPRRNQRWAMAPRAGVKG